MKKKKFRFRGIFTETHPSGVFTKSPLPVPVQSRVIFVCFIPLFFPSLRLCSASRRRRHPGLAVVVVASPIYLSVPCLLLALLSLLRCGTCAASLVGTLTLAVGPATRRSSFARCLLGMGAAAKMGARQGVLECDLEPLGYWKHLVCSVINLSCP